MSTSKKTVKIENRSRNNFAKLPKAARTRIIYLLINGASYDEVRQDQEVAAACAARGVTLHSTTFQAIRRSGEYKRQEAAAETIWAAHEADRVVISAVNDADALATVTDIARYELGKHIRELIQAGPPEDEDISPVEWVERLTRSLRTLIRSEDQPLKAENETLKEQLAGMAARQSNKTAKGISEETLRDVEEKMGLL